MEQNLFQHNLDNIITNIENYCTIQDRCEWDIEKKLNAIKASENIKKNVINHLLSHKFIDNERFSRAFCRGKFRINKWGRVKIRYELRKRQINQECIEKGMQEIDLQDYKVELREQIKKRDLRVSEIESSKKKGKVINYLIQKGYELDLILQELNNFLR